MSLHVLVILRKNTTYIRRPEQLHKIKTW